MMACVQLGFPEEWLSNTFSRSTFGSGLVAIMAGILAWVLAYMFGAVAPFDASFLLLVAGGFIIYTRWRENYGEHRSTGTTSALDNFVKAGKMLINNEHILLLGLIQSCFESAMYIFVFMWTPALEKSLAASSVTGIKVVLPHGVVFAIFMVCMMLGSKAFEYLVARGPAEDFGRWVFCLSSVVLSTPIFINNHLLQLLAFCVFEVCCGIYFPAVVRFLNTAFYVPPVWHCGW